VYNCTRRLFWWKFSLNDRTVKYFWEIKWFHEHFEANVYVVTCNARTSMFQTQYICDTVF
jgi:hypothetical protein